MEPLHLESHPATPCASVRSLTAAVLRIGDELALRYRLDGALGELRLPAPATPAFADRLWEHTCFEAFVGATDGGAYDELNFSPSGEWAHFAFSSYREHAKGSRADALARSAPRAAWCRGANALALDVSVDLAALGRERTASLRLGISAVVEDRDGRRSYWALAHHAEAPDFHDARAFTLRLEPVSAE